MCDVLLHELPLPVLHLFLLMELALVSMIFHLLCSIVFVVGLRILYLVMQVLKYTFHDVEVLLLLAVERYIFVIFGQIIRYLVEMLAY